MGLALAVLIVGCSSTKVAMDWDREVDFSGFETFAWLEVDEEDREGLQLPDHLDTRLRRIVDDVLTEQGLQRAPVLPMADLLLTYYVNVKKELRVDRVTAGYYGTYGYGYWPGYTHGTRANVREYAKGTVVIDIVDRRTQQLVWTSWVQTSAGRPDPSGDRILKVVRKMFDGFPP
jgi:hypothetical protein